MIVLVWLMLCGFPPAAAAKETQPEPLVSPASSQGGSESPPVTAAPDATGPATPSAAGESGTSQPVEPQSLTPEALDALLKEGGPVETTPVISLEKGEIQIIPVDEIRRVVIGDPDVADVEVVSANELFIQAKGPGTTNLILWDRKGQRMSTVEVLDHVPEAIETQLRQLLGQLDIAGVTVHRESNKLFLTGLVKDETELDRLNQLLSAFEGQVTNLVTVAQGVPKPAEILPSVKLTVQLIEMTRDAKEQFGVKWDESLTFTETPFDRKGPTDTMPLAERVEQAFRFGSLTRSALGPQLKLLVSNGKARILAEPKLVAASGKKATATLGVEVPIIGGTTVNQGTTTQNVEFKTTGVELEFQPTVLNDQHSIQLAMKVKVSSIDKTETVRIGTNVVPGFRTRETETEIVTESGQSVIISGLLQDEERKSIGQVPGAGSIPVLGNLFRSTEFQHGKTELIVIVTPEVLGQEEQVTARSDVLEEALASAEVAGSVEDPSLRYALLVQDRIAKTIHFPVREQELGMSGRVKLRVHLFRDGTLGQVTVTESSGIASFDAEAMKAAETQAPYPAFPSELVQPDLWVEVPVLFRP